MHAAVGGESEGPFLLSGASTMVTARSTMLEEFRLKAQKKILWGLCSKEGCGTVLSEGSPKEEAVGVNL